MLTIDPPAIAGGTDIYPSVMPVTQCGERTIVHGLKGD